jgi:hypothetical protein
VTLEYGDANYIFSVSDTHSSEEKIIIIERMFFSIDGKHTFEGVDIIIRFLAVDLSRQLVEGGIILKHAFDVLLNIPGL